MQAASRICPRTVTACGLNVLKIFQLRLKKEAPARQISEQQHGGWRRTQEVAVKSESVLNYD
jgi:hypothetical protein